MRSNRPARTAAALLRVAATRVVGGRTAPRQITDNPRYYRVIADCPACGQRLELRHSGHRDSIPDDQRGNGSARTSHDAGIA
jgi:hypothetical protein